ncbi:MAG: tyrosine-type recombinase/integrase [Actinomycetota bacterium]
MGWILKVEGKRGLRYKAGWRDPSKRVRYKSFPRWRDANEFLKQLEGSKSQGTYRDPSAGREPLESYLTDWLASAVDLRPSTKALYETEARLYVLPWFGQMPLAEIGKGEVRRFIAHLDKRGVGARTIQLSRQLLARVLRQAVDDGLIPANPTTNVPAPPTSRKAPRVLTPAEVETIAEKINPRFRALVLTQAYAALRYGEVAGLRWSRVRLLERKLDIEEQLTEVRGYVAFGPTKSGQRRTVSIPQFIADELAAHAEAFPSNDLVFTASEGGPIPGNRFRKRYWAKAIKAAKVKPPPTPHDLRHFGASVAIQAGAHPKAIQSRLGHASITTTLNTYGALFPHLDEELADALDEIDRSGASVVSL